MRIGVEQASSQVRELYRGQYFSHGSSTGSIVGSREARCKIEIMNGENRRGGGDATASLKGSNRGRYERQKSEGQ